MNIDALVNYPRFSPGTASTRISPRFGDVEVQDFCGVWHRVTPRFEKQFRLTALNNARSRTKGAVR